MSEIPAQAAGRQVTDLSTLSTIAGDDYLIIHDATDSKLKKILADRFQSMVKFTTLASIKAATGYTLGQPAVVDDGTSRSGIFVLRSGAPSEAAGDYQGIELTSAVGASYHWRRLYTGPINVKWFGAVGDGVADDKDIIKTAIETASTLGVSLYIPAGDYRLSDEILPEITGPFLMICAPGAEFVCDQYKQGINIRGAGLRGTTYVLAANATAGDTSITLAAGDTENFAVGDVFYLKSEGLVAGPLTLRTSGAMKKGEWCEVREISGDVLELKRPLYDSYATTDTANVEIADFAKDITLEGFRMRNYWKGLQFHYCKSVVIRDALFGTGSGYIDPDTLEDAISEGMSFNDCIDIHVSNARIYANQDFTYGVVVNYTTQNAVIEGLTGVGCRHTFTINDNGDYGQIRDVTIAFGRSYRSRLAGFDTHNRGENVKFFNCVAYESGDDGFQIRSWKTRLVDCESRHNLNDGFSVEYPSSGFTDPSFVQFERCRAIGNGRVGFNEDDDIEVTWTNCESKSNAGAGWSLKHGRILGGRAEDNSDEAVSYIGTTKGAIIDGLVAPASATQLKFIQGGDGFTVDLSNLVVKSCEAIGYTATRIWASSTGSPPMARDNIITTDGSATSGLEGSSTLIRGQREVIPDGWIWAEDGSFNREVRPTKIEVFPIASYSPNLVYDASDINLSTDFWSGPPVNSILSVGDSYQYIEGDAPVGGMTDEELYDVAFGSFPTTSNLRFTRQFSHGTVQTGFTVPAIGVEQAITNLDNTTSKVGETVQLVYSGTSLRNWEVTETTAGTSPGAEGAIVKMKNLNDEEGRSIANDAPIYGAGVNLTGTPSGTYVFIPQSTSNPALIKIIGAGSRGFFVDDGTITGTTAFKWRVSY